MNAVTAWPLWLASHEAELFAWLTFLLSNIIGNIYLGRAHELDLLSRDTSLFLFSTKVKLRIKSKIIQPYWAVKVPRVCHLLYKK